MSTKDSKKGKDKDKKEPERKSSDGQTKDLKKAESNRKLEKSSSKNPLLPLVDDNTQIHLMNNPLFADMIFVVGNQRINSHNCIVAARCPGLIGPWAPKKKKGIPEIELPKQISINTFMEVIKYTYSGRIQFEGMKEADIILLNAAAATFEGLERLQWLCENQLKSTLGLPNVCTVLVEADKHKLNYMKDYCIQFIVDHYKEIIQNKDTGRQIGVELFQEAVAANTLHETGNFKRVAEKPAPPDTFLDDMKKLYNTSNGSDISFKLTATNALGVSGSIYKCHKAIIASKSPLLANYCNSVTTKDSKDPIVTLKDITNDAFEALLKWIYYGESKFPTIAASELFTWCNEAKLPVLQLICLENMRKGISLDSVLTILDLSYSKEMPEHLHEALKELQPQCISFVVDNFTELDLKQIRERKMNKGMAADILVALQKSGRSNKRKVKKNKKEKKEENVGEGKEETPSVEPHQNSPEEKKNSPPPSTISPPPSLSTPPPSLSTSPPSLSTPPPILTPPPSLSTPPPILTPPPPLSIPPMEKNV